MLFAIKYSGNHKVCLQIVKLESEAKAHEHADNLLGIEPNQWHTVTIQKLDPERETAIVYETGYMG